MTLSNVKTLIQYTGNDSDTEFAYDFFIPTDDEVEVYIYDSSDESVTEINSSQYSITGVGEETFGIVTYPLSGNPLTTTQTITIRRRTALEQTADLRNQSGYYPDVVEDALDNIVRMIQDLDERITRAVRVGVTQRSVDTELPIASAGSYFGWNNAGTGIRNTTGVANTLSWEGAWLTATDYAVNDIVENNNTAYICTVAHTSGASTEPGVGGSWATNWDLFAAGTAGAAGASVASSIIQAFSSTTTDGDPGNGIFRLNNATLASVTKIFMDNVDSDGNTISSYLDTWDDDDIDGYVLIQDKSDKSRWAIYQVSGAVVDDTGYRDISVTYVNANSAFVNTNDCLITFFRVPVPKATAANIRAGTDDVFMTPARIETAVEFVALTDASALAWDWSAGINFSITLSVGNSPYTLQLPTNPEPGTWREIRITQSATGGETLGYATAGVDFLFPSGSAPVLSTGAGDIDTLYIKCIDATTFEVHHSLDWLV